MGASSSDVCILDCDVIDVLCFYSKQATSTVDLDPTMQGFRGEGVVAVRATPWKIVLVGRWWSTTCCRPWTLTSTEQGA